MIRDDMESSGSFGRLSETVFRWNQTKSRMEDRVRRFALSLITGC